MRKIVENGYNTGDYEKFFKKSPKLNSREGRFLGKFMKIIPPKGKILDLGSGVGIPIDKYLVEQGFQLTGIDISIKHIQKAQKSVPGANFLHQDFTKINFQPNSFDAIISFYAIFHIPRTEHDSLFFEIIGK
jgi:2-polyprenyl-3-methyl-5-hydroxy-6-metoxy-1,4-benzoquinol methylase